jgi:putative membrane-bound dehydrogenase-like protein
MSICTGTSKLTAVVVLLLAVGIAVVFFANQPGDSDTPSQQRGLAAITVPPGFEVELAVSSDLVAYPMLGTLDDRGRLFFAESSGNTVRTPEMAKAPDYIIRLVEDVDGDGVYDSSNIFADKLTLPAGAVWYRGSLYVANPPELLRLEDTDKDGVADVREVLLTGWNLSANAASMHGPFLGPDGRLYITDGRHGFDIQTKEGKRIAGKAARIWRCRPDGTELEWLSGGGMDNPVEVTFTDAGETFGTMTYFQNPANGQRDSILHYVEGGVYPKPHEVVDEFPRTGELMPVMTKFARIAPSGLARYRGTALGDDYTGNLFTAQFNPHRIQRHVVRREGATFATTDSDFLTSSDPDFHPTDVMEDADGSLLVVDTGGWFIHGCPVSRIAKPEIRGAVYRVRKKGASRIENPYGGPLADRKAPKLAKLLEDGRWFVRDRAMDLLARAGDDGVAQLTRIHEESQDARVRAAAVFGLLRADSVSARAGLRAALRDDNFLVRVAAARAAGLARDRQAADQLITMLADSEPAVRRQAATALGRLGERRAVPALLQTAATTEDRFVEHAVIYSLIQLSDEKATLPGLTSASPNVQKAALIALDQMQGRPLQRGDAVSLVGTADPELRKTVLWVLARHPEWSSDVLAHVRTRFRHAGLTQNEEVSLHEALLNLCKEPSAQSVVAELLTAPGATRERRLALLGTVQKCAVEPLPSTWVKALERQLDTEDEEIRLQAMTVIRSADLAAMDDRLKALASDASASDAARIAALGILVKHDPRLGIENLEFLYDRVAPEYDADARHSAARVIANAKLDDEWLVRLAEERVRHADPLIQQSLLEAYRRTKSISAGTSLVKALLVAEVVLGDAGSQQLREILHQYPAEVRDMAKPLSERIEKARADRTDRLEQLEHELASGGDVTRGREVFFGKKAACSSCHTMGLEGGDVGPDLTAVGAVRSVHDLIEAIIFPSASFVPGHEIYRVETADDVYSGVLRRRNSEYVVIVSGPNDLQRIPRSRIKSMEPAQVSLMPEGFDENLTQLELSDLFAFLRSQTSREAALAGGG